MSPLEQGSNHKEFAVQSTSDVLLGRRIRKEREKEMDTEAVWRERTGNIFQGIIPYKFQYAQLLNPAIRK